MIDKNEAPYGDEAIKRDGSMNWCSGCKYHSNDVRCPVTEDGRDTCSARNRVDGHDIIFKTKEDDMSEIDVRVGDVWSWGDGDDVTIHRIHGLDLVGSCMSEGTMVAYESSINYLTSEAKLVERDGQKVREFENNAWYPALVGGTKVIRSYNENTGKMRNELGELHSVDTYDWIGDKINLEELK